MSDCTKKCFSHAILIMVFFLSLISLNCFELFQFDKDFSSDNISSELKTSQALNFTVTSNLHKLIWIEGQLNLILTANETGLITCEFKDSNNGNYFTQVNKIVNLTGSNEAQAIRLKFYPHLTTLPGKYNITLNITGFYNYTENFDLILGMGYIILISVLTIFGIGLIIIFVKKKDLKTVKPISVSTEESIVSELEEVPIRKIQCPECKKLIDEGLAFCPECGSRIPEFLRFNPNSPRLL
ncbi:MAG: zinc ribbon domain-containing protein [Candidatus Lokiarchaeota archaeon]|nr:zinc ribbon domain-containing protein [Candidatus Lokiarchaeota archaeon]